MGIGYGAGYFGYTLSATGAAQTLYDIINRANIGQLVLIADKALQKADIDSKSRKGKRVETFGEKEKDAPVQFRNVSFSYPSRKDVPVSNVFVDKR